jgi:ribosomal protein S18 acetylase RimI-like enzyme
MIAIRAGCDQKKARGRSLRPTARFTTGCRSAPVPVGGCTIHAMPDFSLRPLDDNDRDWVSAFTVEHWGADYVVAHSEVYRPEELPGLVAVGPSGEVLGLVTFSIRHDQCEVVTLNSVAERIGVGTALLEAVRELAFANGCSRVWLITTNDNLSAIGFYQRRGFDLVAVHRGALRESRRLKPSIPLVAPNGIPLTDEIELEITKSQA